MQWNELLYALCSSEPRHKFYTLFVNIPWKWTFTKDNHCACMCAWYGSETRVRSCLWDCAWLGLSVCPCQWVGMCVCVCVLAHPSFLIDTGGFVWREIWARWLSFSNLLLIVYSFSSSPICEWNYGWVHLQHSAHSSNIYDPVETVYLCQTRCLATRCYDIFQLTWTLGEIRGVGGREMGPFGSWGYKISYLISLFLWKNDHLCIDWEIINRISLDV